MKIVYEHPDAMMRWVKFEPGATIRVQCQNCKSHMAAPVELEGKWFYCPSCGGGIFFDKCVPDAAQQFFIGKQLVITVYRN